MTAMASGHDAHDAHDDHADHGDQSSFFVVPPMIVGIVIAIVLIAVLGVDTGVLPYHGPLD